MSREGRSGVGKARERVEREEVQIGGEMEGDTDTGGGEREMRKGERH